MNFTPVIRGEEPVAPPKRKPGGLTSGSFKKGHTSYARQGTIDRAEDKLMLARRIYTFLYSLGKMTSPHHAALGWWNQRGHNTIFRTFGRTKQVDDILISLAKQGILRYENKKTTRFYSVREPIHPDFILEDDDSDTQ